MENIKWLKDIIANGERYAISDMGNVYILDKDGSIKSKSKFFKHKDGYNMITLHGDEKDKTITIHRLVMLAFSEKVENRMEINHKDGNRINNVINNLEWCTHKENIRHGYLRKKIGSSVSINDIPKDTDIINKNEEKEKYYLFTGKETYRQKVNYYKNREKRLEYQKEYDTKNKSKRLEKQKLYREKKKQEKALR